MTTDFQSLIPPGFSPEARIWIYQSDKMFSPPESRAISGSLAEFTRGWRTHGDRVAGFGHCFFDQFIVLLADESEAAVSGCSTDGSVRFVKSFEPKYGVSLFDRQLLAFFIDGRVKTCPLSRLSESVAAGTVTADTLYFDNTVATLAEWKARWIIPVNQSWLKTRKVFAQAAS